MTQSHSPKNINTLAPKYVTKFQCLGKNCPDTCCAGWNVVIDRKTYQLYKSIELKEIKDEIKKSIHRNRQSPSESNYAYIDMQGTDKSCPFLKDKLCSIQLHKGERYLSNTCSTFPRRTTHMAGSTEQTLSLACPEAARLALLDPDALELTVSTLELRPITIEHLEFSDQQAVDTLILARAAILTILKNEHYHIQELLAILSLFLEELGKKINTKDYFGAQKLIEQTVEGVQETSFPNLSSLPKFHQDQIQICLEIFRLKSNFSESKFFSALTHHAQNGKPLLDSYQQGLAIIENNPTIRNTILRNYCAHEIFQSKIPCIGEDTTVQLSSIIINFYLIKTVMAISLASCEPNEEVDLAVSLIRNFSKGYQHDNSFRSAINELVNRMQWKSFERIQVLLLA